jgi:hypothetical protein
MRHIRPFKFDKTESSKANKLYLFVLFEGGDADTDHPEYYEFKNIKFSEYENHLDEIKEKIDKYLILKDILDNHDYRTASRAYDKIKSKYGEDIAKLYDNTPNDPQADYHFHHIRPILSCLYNI